MTNYAHLKAPTTLEIIRELPGPIQRVWDHITKSELKAKWLCAGDIPEEVGSKIIYDFDHNRLSTTPIPPDNSCAESMVVEGEVLEVDKPNYLRIAWPGEPGSPPSVVSIWLTTKGDKVQLRLTHEKLDSRYYQVGASAGWHAHLDMLGDLLSGAAQKDFWRHYSEMEADYEERYPA